MDLTPLDAPGLLIVCVGPSAAGKTTFAARFPSTARVCLDDLRGMVADDESDQSATGVAAQLQDLILDARLSRGLRTVVDSTNLLPHVRAKLLAKATVFRRPIVAVLWDTVPFSECARRNAARHRQVPLDILREQHTMIPSAQQLLAEGFDDVLSARAMAFAAGGAR